MARATATAFIIGLTVLASSNAHLNASGLLGIYGIVEKAVFEPNDAAPERLQLWGAFAYSEGGSSLTISKAHKGYLYFKLPDPAGGPRAVQAIETIKKEWADLKAVAGTGQAVGFGRWTYIGVFSGLDPLVISEYPPFVMETMSPGGSQAHLRVRPASETPAIPGMYQTNVGVVKISAQSHAAIVKALKDALK